MLKKIEQYFEKCGNKTTGNFQYGTAGFRGDSSILDRVFQRIGLFAIIRSYITQNSYIGICITASHNVHTDNGVKLCDHDGGLLDASFEYMITDFINSNNPYKWFIDKCSELSIDLSIPGIFHDCKIITGYDTRPTSIDFARQVYDSIELLESQWVQLGAVTTPQLQFAVEQSNIPEIAIMLKSNHILHYFSYFENIIRHFTIACKKDRAVNFAANSVFIDCANGVGALHIIRFQELLKELINVNVNLRNTGDKEGDILNYKCGSDYIQRLKMLPDQFYNDEPLKRCCAFDGDADRIIYFSYDEHYKLILYDGDRIAILFLYVLLNLLTEIQSTRKEKPKSTLSICFVQTAYANKGSTDYFEQVLKPKFEALGQIEISLDCVKSGVKYLHSAAQKSDIGIYFESNGHGTILLKEQELTEWYPSFVDKQDKFCSFLSLFNKTTGDAMMNFVAVELSLIYMGWNHENWLNLYVDRPCLQDTVNSKRVNLNKLIPHKKHEKYLIEPVSLQKEFDSLVSLYQNARLFVRPSGTEEKCRIYVEAETVEDCQTIMEACKSLLYDFLETDE